MPQAEAQAVVDHVDRIMRENSGSPEPAVGFIGGDHRNMIQPTNRNLAEAGRARHGRGLGI